MERKRCHACAKLSYSISRVGAWICPHCGKDLSDQPVLPRHPSSHWVLPLRLGLGDELWASRN